MSLRELEVRSFNQMAPKKAIHFNPVQDIVFLDVDGVLNRQNEYGYYTTLPTPDMDTSHIVDLNICEALCCVLSQLPTVKIVLISTWRLEAEFFDIVDKIRLNPRFFHDDWRTPVLSTRREEIDMWLLEHPEVRRHVVVDDKFHEQYKGFNLVKVVSELGLTVRDMDQIANVFGMKLMARYQLERIV